MKNRSQTFALLSALTIGLLVSSCIDSEIEKTIRSVNASNQKLRQMLDSLKKYGADSTPVDYSFKPVRQGSVSKPKSVSSADQQEIDVMNAALDKQVVKH